MPTFTNTVRSCNLISELELEITLPREIRNEQIFDFFKTFFTVKTTWFLTDI